MELYVFDNYDEVSRYGARLVSNFINEKSDCVLGLATGSTPLGMYKKLIDYNKDKIVDFSKVRTFNLDEYKGLSGEHPQSYRYFMDRNFFDYINIDINNTFIPHGNCEDTAKECREYEEKINEAGGIDLQILGIGSNGHIGFNEPSSELYVHTHLADLKQETIKANSRFFENAEQVPKQAITIGMGQIMKAKKIILLASGINKANAVGSIFNGKVNTNNPSSILQMHPSVAVIADKEAASLL